MSSHSISSGLRHTLFEPKFMAYDELPDRYDVIIKFLSAENVPKMDTVGHADPYFTAKIDDHITYTSSIVSNTSTPQWDDEEWIVRNIPSHAKLFVTLFDKDDQKLTDDYIGQFEVINLIDYHAPSGGHDIVDLHEHNRGQFHLTIRSEKSSTESKQLPEYTFDGPCRYFRHNSLAIGRLTMLNTDCVYSTWKIEMKRLPVFFPPDRKQDWNRHHQIARTVFGGSPLSLASKSALKLAHKVLYGRTLKHNENGRLNNANDLWQFIFTDKVTQQIKPCLYTYVIDNNTWRFSETGNQLFTDIASKHALLSNCSESVRYAGQFHPRPKYGWDRCDDEWELVLDNESGTYAPTADLLGNLKDLLLYNFPGLNVVVYDYKDPRLKESIEQLKVAMEKYINSTVVVQHLVFNHASPV